MSPTFSSLEMRRAKCMFDLGERLKADLTSGPPCRIILVTAATATKICENLKFLIQD